MKKDKLKQKIIKEFVEKGANLEHERWARWQKYMFSKCRQNKDGSLTIPTWAVSRWGTQIEIAYKDLSEEEKESDRKETRNYLPLLERVIDQVREETKKEIMGEIEKMDYLELSDGAVIRRKDAKEIIKKI